MKIEVTQIDIDRGVPCSSGLCPVALAAQRSGLRDVKVDGASLFYNGTQAWLNQGEFVHPFSFEIYMS